MIHNILDFITGDSMQEKLTYIYDTGLNAKGGVCHLLLPAHCSH